MENLVNKIIEIDRMADSRINTARKQSRDMLKNSDEQCKKIVRDIEAAAEKRIAEIENINKSEYDLKAAALDEKISNEKEEMDCYFRDHHIEIEKKIFAEIVGEQFEIR